MRWLVLALLLAGAAFVVWRMVGPRTVSVTSLSRGPAVVAVYATGTVEPTVMMPVAARVMGRLVERPADEGDRVRKGQVLARLESDELRSATAELETRRRQAADDLRRAQTLLDKGVATRVGRDKARTELNALDAQIRRMRAQMGYTALVAPADGQIIRRDGEVGELIAVNQPLFWMACCAPLRISAEVDEEDVALVRPGQSVLIRSDAFAERTFRGTVAQITPKGDPVARSYRVRITLPTDTPLMIGMTTETNILIDRRENALLAPAGALRDGQLWIVQGGRAVPRPVKVGVASGARVELLDGVRGDEQVIVNPPEDIAKGERVQMTPWEPPAASRQKEGLDMRQMGG